MPTLAYNFSAPKAAADDIEAAKMFLAESEDFFLKGETVENLRAGPKREGGGAVHIDFQQYHEGVPVWDSILSVHIAGDNIIMVNGEYIPDIQLDTTPTLSAEEALEAVKRDLGPNTLLHRDTPRPQLFIKADGVKPLLCWRVNAHTLSPLADWEYFVDASTGAIVLKHDRVRRATGTGYIFPDNPVVTPNVAIGVFNYLDGGGNSVLRGNFAEVKSFKMLDPTGVVVGEHEAVSPTLNFGYLPTQRAFSEQMVYYHMNRARDYFRLLGFSNLDSTRLPAYVHYREFENVPYDNSAFIPTQTSGYLIFGDGSGRVGTGKLNSAFDAEIIFHEYAHAVIFNRVKELAGPGNGTDQATSESYAKAMDEGYADYFACSSFNTPIIGQWKMGTSPHDMRRLDNAHRYPDHVNDPRLGRRESHYTGLIWSGGLWDIRAALGSGIADPLILGSLDFMKRSGTATFQDGLVALINANIAMRLGAQVPVIQQKMNARGIFEPLASFLGDTQFSALHNNTPQTGSIGQPPAGLCLLAAKQFSVYVPPGTSSLTVDGSGNGNINMYVRFGAPVIIANNAVVSNYRSESAGNVERVSVSMASSPGLVSGTYYVAFLNCAGAAVNYSVNAVIGSDGASRTDEVRLTSGAATNNIIFGTYTANHAVGVLGDVQYFIDVPTNARLLNVRLIGVTPGADVDLFVRAGKRVEIDDQGSPVMDRMSPTPSNIESVEFDSSTSKRLVPGTKYFIAIANFSAVAAAFQLTATVSTTATLPSEASLTSGTAKSDALSGFTLSPTNYVLQVPNGASQLRVELVSNSGTAVDLHVRQGSRVFVNGTAVVSDFFSANGGPAQALVLGRGSTFPLDSDVYYIAVGNRTPAAINFTLLATFMQGGGTQVSTQVLHGATVSNVVDAPLAGAVVIDGDQFFVDVPASVTSLKVRLEGPESNLLALLGKVGSRVDPTDGDVEDILDTDTEFGKADILCYVNGVGTVTIARPAVSPYPTLQTNRYFFAVANRSGGAALYRLTFTMSPAPAPAVVQFSAGVYSVAESGGSARITVTRSGNTSTPVTVNYATNGGTASSRSDYALARGTFSFAAGETSKNFNVLIADDALVEGGETVGLSLSSLTDGATPGALSNATLTINDNDTVATLTNPLDGAQFFARQHYADFLNRAPDTSGLNFWTNDIAQCGANAQCLEVKRINVSAAFFLSIEFQQTGFLVYRLYRTSFNRIPRLEEFQPDTQTIGANVIVGATGWEQLLENNKQAFANRWVLRNSFREVYDQLSDVEYVDTLIANTGVAVSPFTRAALILGLGTGAETRATVLRKVADDQSFSQRELNAAFVLSQYFGYLRRNPNDLPDADFSGFNFWLGKLNQFNGDFIRAEMVKAFLSSTEYRQRFGQR